MQNRCKVPVSRQICSDQQLIKEPVPALSVLFAPKGQMYSCSQQTLGTIGAFES